MHSDKYFYMYWMTLFICEGLGVVYQVSVQDLIVNRINKCVGTSWDMGEDDDFKLLYENTHLNILVEEEWIKETKYIIELRHN